jgi:hypothetical protein
VSDGITATVSGASAITEAIQRVLEQAPGAVQVGLLVEGTRIAADAVQRCPVDSGELRASVFVKPTAGHGVEVGFSAPHAAYVHERTDLHHDEGEAKFLEKAKNAAASTLASDVAAMVRIG